MGTVSKSKGASRSTKNHNAASGRQPGGWPPSPHHNIRLRYTVLRGGGPLVNRPWSPAVSAGEGKPTAFSRRVVDLSHDDARLLQFGLFSIALRVMESKRYDYSGDEDPYRNFRFSAGVGVEPWRGALVRMLDKVSRIVRFAELGGDMRVKEESLVDTVVDLINYACITFGLIIESFPPKDRANLLARLEEEAGRIAK